MRIRTEMENYPSKNCSLLALADEENYQHYVNNHPQATFEYSLGWRDIIKNNFGFKPYYVISKNEDGQMNGILPLFLAKSIFGRRLVSIPYAVYTGLLTDNAEIEQNLIGFARELANELSRTKKVNFLEIREREEKNWSKTLNFQRKSEVFNFSLKLSTNPEEVWKKLPKSSVRWGIKKAQNSGLTFRQGNTLREAADFYRLFLATRKKRGVPGYPLKYFQEILAVFKDKLRIYLADYQGKPVAAIFLLYHKKEVRYAFAGAVHDQQIMPLQPYHLLIWEAIKDACREGYVVFNFGGATLQANDGGLYEFKKRWADTITPVSSYYHYPYNFHKIQKENTGLAENTVLSKVLLKTASQCWKHLPLWLIKRLDPYVIKQFV